jgi:2,4-dienoyl-CoA reductase-like NADH-dependent reductase (Old Yellow Enzyme family)
MTVAGATAGDRSGRPALFRPLKLRSLALANRIVVAPMCQYSADHGRADDWHLVHLGSLALSGAGMLITEATAVEAHGRITPQCLGLYDDACEAALARVLGAIRRHSDIPVAIQLAHAGRKASVRRPWDGRGSLPAAEGGWPVVGPSALPFDAESPMPEELDRGGMDRIVAAFVAAVRRCGRLGIDAIELHGGHGYLLSSFLSPLANRRSDAYGGSLENRMRFPLEVFDAVRAAWGDARPLGMRINGSDWHPDGITPDEAAAFAAQLAAHGCDFVDVSSGGNAEAAIPVGPGYQVPLAARVREKSGLPTIAVGMIRSVPQATQILEDGHADLVGLARPILNDPRWPWHAAEDLGVTLEVAPQLRRGALRGGAPGHLESLNTARRHVAA